MLCSLDDAIIIVMTCMLYCIANGFTYDHGVHNPCDTRPLRDMMHEFLPDLSKWVYVRDVVLCLFFVPFLCVTNKWTFMQDLLGGFMVVLMIKAVCIFFTFIPPSNPHCNEKKYINHCFHSSTSGHASLTLLLAILYIKYGLFSEKEELVYGVVFLYCILILMTRAHYTVDICQALAITWLAMH